MRPFCIFVAFASVLLSYGAAGAAESARPKNPGREVSFSKMRETIVERDRALRGFSGQFDPDRKAHLERAGQIADGTVFFYGDTPVKVGLRDVDWTGGHIKHQEWPAQLNRFYYLGDLAAAYRQTKDERFARAARAYIEDWIRSDPGYATAEDCRPGDNTLNISIRLGTSEHSGWGGILPAFLDSPSFDGAFLKTVMDSLSGQASFLSRHLTTVGNWRISQLDALVFTALRFPFLENAPELLEIGIKGVRNALATQFLPDGVHIERTPGYHRWMASVAVNYYDLARRFPEADAFVDPDIAARALDYDAQCELYGVNDAMEPHRDPERLRSLEGRAEDLRHLFPGKDVSPPPLEQVFASAGHVFARSAWKPGADYLAFDAGTWGGGHCHLSRLSFELRIGGRELVADPGILSYEMSDPLAPYGKSTQAHSTLNLNGWNQSEADAGLLRTEFTPETALIHARYQGGYWPAQFGWGFDTHDRGAFGSHQRVLFWVKGQYLLVLDSMESDRGTTVHNVWQTGPMDAWSVDKPNLSWQSKNKDVNLFLQFIGFGQETEMDCFEGSREPLRGWLGSSGHDGIAAPLVEFRYDGHLWGGSMSAVLLVPFAGEVKPAYALRRAANDGDGTYRIELGLPDGGMDVIKWSKGLTLPVGDTDPKLATDATFIWLRLDAAGKPARCFLLDGRYLTYDGRSLYQGGEKQARLLSLGEQ